MTTPGLEIEHVSVSFDGSPVLADVSLRVDRGAPSRFSVPAARASRRFCASSPDSSTHHRAWFAWTAPT